MKIHINRNIIILGLVLFVELLLYLFFLLTNISLSTVNVIIVFFSAIVYGYVLCVLYTKNRAITFTFLFIMISYPFYFGRHILFLIDSNTDFLCLDLITFKTFLTCSFFQLFAITGMSMGSMMIDERKQCINVKKTNTSKNILYVTLLFLILISFYPQIDILVDSIRERSMIGYGESMINSLNSFNIKNIFANLFLPATLGLLVLQRRLGYICLIIYFCLYLLSGSRIIVFGLIPAIILFISTIRKINSKKFIKYIAIICIFATIFSGISLNRSDKSLNNPLKEVLINVLYEAGLTYRVNSIVIENTPKNESFQFGDTYAQSIIYILPNKVTGLDYTGVDDTFSKYVTNYGGIGSSFIAEGYYNFGFFSLIVFFFYGMIMAKIDSLFFINIKNKSYFKSMYYLYIMSQAFLLIRSDVLGLLRTVIWNFCIIYIIYNLIGKMIFKRKRAED